MALYCRRRNAQLPEVMQLPRPRFGHVAREMIGVNCEEFEGCLEEQRRTGCRIGEVMLRRGILDRQQIKRILRVQARWTVAIAECLFPGSSFPLKSCLSLCLPAYNEAANIEDTLDGAFAILPEFVEDFEIVVANDGSRDGTGEILARYAETEPRLRVATHAENLGYGAALTSALRAARGDLVCIVDSDGQFSLLNLPQFLRRMKDCEAVIGYRRRRADHWLRRFDAWAWNRLVRLVLGVSVRDVDCAFKLFRREIVEGLVLSSRGACISAEILVQCVRKGVKTVELPVDHYSRAHGAATGAAIPVICRAFRELPRLMKHRWLPRASKASKTNKNGDFSSSARDGRFGPVGWRGTVVGPSPSGNRETACVKEELPDVPLTICMLAACSFPANH